MSFQLDVLRSGMLKKHLKCQDMIWTKDVNLARFYDMSIKMKTFVLRRIPKLQ